MNLMERQEEEQDLAAAVSDVRFYEGVLNLMCEGFRKRTGLFVAGHGCPAEFTYEGYLQYVKYLKNSIETIRSIIKYIDAQEAYKKGEDSQGAA